jgi:hypothetical protein
MRGGLNVRGYGAGEKDKEGRALKILTRAEDMPDGEDNLDRHAYIHVYTLEKSPTFRNRAGPSWRAKKRGGGGRGCSCSLSLFKTSTQSWMRNSYAPIWFHIMAILS